MKVYRIRQYICENLRCFGGIMKRFIDDIKKYYKYTVYAAKAELKSEVAGSYLGWMWWFLEPFCFMLVYAFMVVAVLAIGSKNIFNLKENERKKEENKEKTT